mgnify:CR=1 FL=1
MQDKQVKNANILWYYIYNIFMDLYNKKISKKKEFRDSIPIEEHNIETVNMENKLKNIRKRKKNVKNNFKNIETFNTLTNNQDKEKNDKKEDKKSGVESFNNIIEGQTNINDKENRDNWEGHDDVEDPEGDLDWRESFARSMENTYDSSVKILNMFSDSLTDGISGGTATANDKKIIAEYISVLIAALFSFPISYNWYFLMFYILDNQDVKIPHLSISDLKKQAIINPDDPESAGAAGPLALFLFFFEFAIMFPCGLDYLLTILIPSFFATIFNGKMNFILIFFTVFFVLKNCVSAMKDFFVGLVRDTTSNVLMNLMFAAVFIMFFVSFAETLMDPEGARMYLDGWMILLPLLFIRLLLIMIISVPLGAAMCIVYFFAYSFFAISIYSKENYSELIKKLNFHIDNSIPSNLSKSCEGESIFNTLLRMAVNFFSIFKSNLLSIVFVLTAIAYIFIMNSELSNNPGMLPGFTLKQSFVYLNFIFIITIGTSLYLSLGEQLNKVLNLDKDV